MNLCGYKFICAWIWGAYLKRVCNLYSEQLLSTLYFLAKCISVNKKRRKKKKNWLLMPLSFFFRYIPSVCRLFKEILFQKFIGCYLFSTCQINICAFLSLGRQIYWAGYQLPRMSYSYVCCDWNLIHLRAPGGRDKIEQKSIYKQIRTNLKAFIVIYFVAA